MNAVLGMAQILAKTTLDIEQKQYVNTIIGSSNSLVKIINDILDFSKIEAGKIDILEDEVALEFLCLEICHLLSTRAHEKGLKLYLNYRARNCGKIIVDEGRLRQILINLISNAIKFTETGHVELCIESTPNSNSELIFSIKDTGIGISESVKNKLFSAYAQADERTSQKFGGTGLGLQISQRLVTLMGGNISVDSIEGEGSNFWFTLPVKITEARDSLDLAGKSCLLISDDLYSNTLLTEMMHNSGMTIDITASSDEAFKALSSTKKYDLFIVDNTEKEHNNTRVFRHIKAQERHKKATAIMLVNIGDHQDQLALFDAGVDVYIPKPISPSLIYKAVKAFENRHPSVCKAMYISNENKSNDTTVNIEATGRVLIAEDVEVNQVILTSMLTQIGLEVDIANNGEEAVEMVERHQYDMVFMDCRMPIMDGFEATKKVREMSQEYKTLTIVALTANAGESDKKACINAGMSDYLSKPYTEKDLMEVIEKWMETKAIETPVEENTNSDIRENEILDYVQFDCIKSSLEDEFANFALDITDKFIIYQQDIITALKNGDMKKVYEKAHALAGVSAMIGAKQVREIALSIEEAGGEGDLEKSIVGLSKLDAAISKTHSMIIICLNPEIERSLHLF